MTMKPMRYAWFPYAFALVFPLTVYSHNQAAFAGIEILRPALLFLLLAAIFVLSFRRLVGDRPLADVLATIPLVSFWLLGFGWQIFAVLVLLIAVTAYFRKHELPSNMVPILNALAIGVLILPLLAILQVQRVTHDDSLQKIPFSPFHEPSSSAIAGEKPDIYHIVLDAYAGGDALTNVLGFDNSIFFEQLRELGFAVNESVHVPYNETVHTMSSIFLGEYLRYGEFPIDSATPSQLRSTLGALIPNGPLHAILRENDYTVLHTETGHDFLRYPGDAVILQAPNKTPLSRFELHLGTVSGLESLLPVLYEVSDDDPLIRAVKNAFDNDFQEFQSPKFVYEHVIAPHTPFIIDRTGAKTSAFPGFPNTTEGDRVVRNDPTLRRLYIAGYLEKLRYVNDRVLDQVRRLIETPGKKVILLHGDHGSGAHYFMDNPELTCFKERFTSFLAVYSNDTAINEAFGWLASDDAAPVNLYRSLLGSLLGLELEMLPNRSSFVRYFEPHHLMPFERELIRADCSTEQAAGR